MSDFVEDPNNDAPTGGGGGAEGDAAPMSKNAQKALLKAQQKEKEKAEKDKKKAEEKVLYISTNII